MTNLRNPQVLTRYAAHLIALVLGAVVSALMLKGASFSVLASQAFGVSLVVLVGGWLATVATLVSDTGDVPERPPAALVSRVSTLEQVAADHDAQIGGLEGAVSGIASRLPEQPAPPPRT